MRIPIALTIWLLIVATGCDDNRNTETTAAVSVPPKAGNERGGTITVGNQTWTFVPAMSCSIYPNGIVNLAGHAAEDPTLEITIDYGGPNQITVGEGREAIWHAMPDTLEIELDGRHVQGTATFNEYLTGTGESAQGLFDINC